jgi:hypothetical protein
LVTGYDPEPGHFPFAARRRSTTIRKREAAQGIRGLKAVVRLSTMTGWQSTFLP